MMPTPWEFRNRLLAILSTAKHSGQPYIDVESSNIRRDLGGEVDSNEGVSVCHDIMKRLMRPGDSILMESDEGEPGTIMIRYLLKVEA